MITVGYKVEFDSVNTIVFQFKQTEYKGHLEVPALDICVTARISFASICNINRIIRSVYYS
jgi:hypothetical protein